jgi:hypothetical protein
MNICGCNHFTMSLALSKKKKGKEKKEKKERKGLQEIGF